MSFRQFVCLCACGGAVGAALGWVGSGWLIDPGTPIGSALRWLAAALGVALPLHLLDTAWNLSFYPVVLESQRALTATILVGVGGFLGGLLAYLSPWLGSAAGGCLLGLSAGAVVGAFDYLVCTVHGRDTSAPGRRALLNALAGAAAGFVGGLLLAAMQALGPELFSAKPAEQLWSGDVVGSMVLGLAIGLAVGLAQVQVRQHWLTFEQGPQAGREVLLFLPSVTLGRDAGCEVLLHPDYRLEMIHARLDRQGGGYTVVDAGTIDGTLVNGVRLTGPHHLRSGDLIQIGDCVLRYGARTQ